MKKPYKMIGIVAAVLVVAIIALRIATRGCGETVESISGIQKREGVPVRVETAALGTISHTLQFSGTLEGEEQAVIVSRLLEVVTEIPLRVGQRVSRGQVVARLDNSNPQAMYRQARSTRDDAKLDHERMQALFAQGAVSQQTLDKAKLGYEVAQSNLEAAADLVELRSPVAGEIVRVHVQPGEMAAPGQPLVTVAASKQIRVRFQASAEERRSLQEGQPARIHLTLSDTATIAGVVEKVEDAADPRTRLFDITVTSDNPEGLLKPGALTNVEVVVEERQGTLVINREALIGNADHHEVFIVDAAQQARKRTVTIGLETSRIAEVIAGLTAGERVVVYGQNRLAEGDRIRIIEG